MRHAMQLFLIMATVFCAGCGSRDSQHKADDSSDVGKQVLSEVNRDMEEARKGIEESRRETARDVAQAMRKAKEEQQEAAAEVSRMAKDREDEAKQGGRTKEDKQLGAAASALTDTASPKPPSRTPPVELEATPTYTPPKTTASRSHGNDQTAHRKKKSHDDKEIAPEIVSVSGDNATVVLSDKTSVTLSSGMKFTAHGHTYVTTQMFSATSIKTLVRNQFDRLITQMPDGKHAFTIQVKGENGRVDLGLPTGTPLIPEQRPWSFVAAFVSGSPTNEEAPQTAQESPEKSPTVQTAPAYYAKSQDSLALASECAGQWKATEGTDSSKQFPELQQRAFLLSDIARVQASIGDVRGVEASLDRIRKLSATKVGGTRSSFDLSDALIALAVGHANQGNVPAAEQALAQLTAKETHTIDSVEKATARGLAQVAVAMEQRGDIEGAKAFLQRLAASAEQCKELDNIAFILGELGKAYAGMGLFTETIAVTQRITDLRSKASGDDKKEILAAVNGALCGVAIAQAEAGDQGASVEKTISLIEDSELASNGAWFGVGEARAKAMDFPGAFEACVKITDDWTQTRLTYAIGAAQAELGPMYEDNLQKIIELGGEKMNKFSKTAAWDQLFCDCCMVGAKSPSLYKGVLGIRDKLTHAEHEALALAAAAVSATRSGQSDEARDLFEKAVECARRAQTTEKAHAYEDIGTRFIEAGQSAESLTAGESSTFVKGSLLLGIARGILARETVQHAAHEGIVLPGRATGATKLDAAGQNVWRDLIQSSLIAVAEKGQGPKYTAKPDGTLPEYQVSEIQDGEVVVVPGATGAVLAFPPRLSGIKGFLQFMPTGLFSEPTDVKEFLERPVGYRQGNSKFQIEKRIATRPSGWIVVTVEVKQSHSKPETASITGAASRVNSNGTAKAESVAEDPVHQGKPLSTWIKAMKAEDVAMRRQAVFVLGFVKGPDVKKVIAALAMALKDSETRGMAMLSLGVIGDEGVPALTEALRGGQEAAQDFITAIEQARKATSRAGERDVAPLLVAPLIKVVRADEKAAVAAGTILSMIGRPAVAALIPLLDDNNVRVRGDALATLSEMGAVAKEAIPAIEKRLNDSNPGMRELAAEALKKLAP